MLGVKHFSVGIFDGSPSTARSSFFLSVQNMDLGYSLEQLFEVRSSNEYPKSIIMLRNKKHISKRLWVLIRTASMWGFLSISTINSLSIN